MFEHRVLRMLLSRGKMTRDLVALIRSWRHSGFQVYVGSRIQPGEEEATENLARYIIQASFSQEGMTYVQEESKVLEKSCGVRLAILQFRRLLPRDPSSFLPIPNPLLRVSVTTLLQNSTS